MQNEPTVDEISDSCGTRVVLATRLWREKIVRDHPEIEPHLGEVMPTVASPDHTEPDPGYESRVRYYARGVGPSRWLLVLVSYEQTPARVVSVFGTRKDPKSWSG